ncbi:MAG: hypothetical protein HY860_07150 [Chlamydiales bacterium]|nr:hypothetical protein [Chlamydiales bacterium]
MDIRNIALTADAIVSNLETLTARLHDGVSNPLDIREKAEGYMAQALDISEEAIKAMTSAPEGTKTALRELSNSLTQMASTFAKASSIPPTDISSVHAIAKKIFPDINKLYEDAPPGSPRA